MNQTSNHTINNSVNQIIFHIDCNSAYLSWTAIEKLKEGSDLDLRKIPAIIGGDQRNRRGVVLAKSIPAKKFGVRTGEPVAAALRKCPHLVMEPPNHRMYHIYSQQLMKLLNVYTNDLEQVSVDETYLDFTPITPHYSSPIEAATIIKDHIREKLHFTVNIGIAPNKLLAKMASDFEKPDKVHTLFHHELEQKLWPLPVGKLYTVGRASEDKLHRMGIKTIGDLAHTDLEILISHFKSHGKKIWEFANGIDNSRVISEKREAKGIGNSTTLRYDIISEDEAKKILLDLSQSVSARLREAKQITKTVIVEIKYNDFSSFSHQGQLLIPTNTTDSIYTQAFHLFKEFWNHHPIRLLGVRTTNLLPEDAPVQLNLFDYPLINQPTDTLTKPLYPLDEKRKKLDQALDSIKKKYGNEAVVRGSLFHKDSDSSS